MIDGLKNKVVYSPRKEANIIKDFFPTQFIYNSVQLGEIRKRNLTS